MKKFALFMLAVVASTLLSLAAGDASLQDPSLLFKASFDTYSVTADKGNGGRESTNFKPASLMLRMHQGVAGIGNSLTLNNRESVAWPNKGNHDWRKGTISFWVSSKNWLPDKKRFQIFFQSKFTHDTRFIIYKFIDPGQLRFVIIVKNKEVGYVNIPLNNADWQPDTWHKIDAVWDDKSMALYLDGNLAKHQPYTMHPYHYRSPLQFPEDVKPSFMHLGMDPGFSHDPNDVTAFDELEIYDRILTHAEIRAGYEKFIKPVNTGENPHTVTLPEGKNITIDGKIDEAEWADAAIIPVNSPVRHRGMPLTNAKVYLKQNGGNMLVGAEIIGGDRAALQGNDLVDVWRDDAFEIHLLNASRKRFQFIINPLGSFFDATFDRDDGKYDLSKINPSWNSGAKSAVYRGDGVWFVEMSIPKANIGVTANEILGTFCATRYLDKSYHVTWGQNAENFYDEKAFGRILFGGSNAKPVRFELYAPYQGHFILNPEVNLKLLASGGRTIERPAGIKDWKLDLKSGIYDLTAKGQGYYYTSRFTIDQPLVISYTCYASRKTLEVKADLSAAGSAVRNAMQTGSVKGTVRLVDESGKAFIEENFTAVNLENIINLTLPELKQGTYYVEAVVNSGDGNELKARKRFRIPDMTPYKLQVAKDHTVPPPWTPVKQSGKREFQVWHRTYTFGEGPFPVQVVSEGEKLLKKGPEFYLDGAPVTWQGFKITEKHDDYYRFEGTGTAGKLTFRWVSDLCFDGLVKVKVHMKPVLGKAEINRLRLKWSVPAEYARAMLEPLYSGYRNQDGEVYNFSYGHGEDFIIWTVGLEKGFLYWPQSNANWRNPAGHKQFSLSRQGDTVHLNADYITMKSTLDKEAVYSLAFMATPGRPEPERRRDFNLGQIWDFLKYETAKIQYFGVSAKPAPESTEPWTSLKPLDPVKFGQHIKDIAAKGSSYLPYSQPVRTCTVEESYDYFFPEWRQKPGWPVGGGISHLTGEFYEPEAACGHTGAGDLFVYRADKLLSDFPDLPGLYYDISEGRICWNTLHGCGGIDAFGKEYGDSNLLTHRDYFIRLKRVLAKHGKDKILFLHAHNRFIPFCHGIGDYWYPGEQYNETITINIEHFYCENIPLVEWQSAYSSPIHGSGLVFLGCYQNTMWRYNLKTNYAAPKYALSVLTPVLLHDLGITNSYVNHDMVERWWIIKHDTDLATAKFHGYWFSDAVKSASDKVYASWYSWDGPAPYKRLIVVGNMGRTEQPAALTIDEKALGIKGKKVKFYDLWENQEITDLSALKVGGNNFKLIGIK